MEFLYEYHRAKIKVTKVKKVENAYYHIAKCRTVLATIIRFKN